MRKTEIMLIPEQKKALDLMLSGKNIFLTGKAGTGKSTVLQQFQEKCKSKCVFLAPTGRAAININGSTIHSFFNLKPVLLTPESIDEIINRKRIDLIHNVQTIVVDEVSLVRSDLFVAMDMRLQEITGNNRPFGGKQVILVGDFLQLAPVVRAREESDYLDHELGGHYAFQTDLWKQAKFQCVCLQTIHRQQNDELLMSILNHLRYGELETCDLLIEGLKSPVNAIEALTRLCVTNSPLDHTPVYLCTTNRDAEALNQFHQGKLKGEACVFRAVVRGKFPEADFPTSEALALKVGARVMTLTNKRTSDGEIEYVNGELGIVESIDNGNDAGVRVRLDRGDTVTIQRTKWSKYEYELEIDANRGRSVIRQHEVGTFVQIPLKLAYAVTVHKAQGLTLDYVEVKLGNGCFAPGQLYTALSRCRSIKNLRIDRPICLADAVIDQAVIDFYRKIDPIQQVKGKHTAVAMNVPATDEDVVRDYLRSRERSGTKRRAMPQEDTDKPKTRKPSISPEPDSVKEAKSQKITSSPDIDHLLVVYRNQNPDERDTKMTKRMNGIGFNKQDAPVLTELAEEYLEKGFLTEGELERVHRLIAKYRRQWA